MPAASQASLDQYFVQYQASVAAMQSMQFPSLRDDPLPTATECRAYAQKLAALETDLLCKRDQIDLLWLEFRAWMHAGAQLEALACMERAAPVVAVSAKKLPFAKLPTIGHTVDERRQVHVMVEMAEDGFWNTELSERVKASIKALSKAAK